MRVEETVEIRCPPEEIWAFVANPTNDPRWCRKVQSVGAAEAGRWTVIHRPVPLRPATALDVRQVELDAPSRLTLREEDDASVFDVEYRLVAIPDGTRFTQVSEFEWKRLPRILHRPFARGVRRDVRGQLRKLKEVLEAG
jgi:uncharacterized protein YndB with AHSA1/START domain